MAKNGLDRKDGEEPERPSNVVSFTSARKQAEKGAAKRRAATAGDHGRPGITIGQWIVGGLFMLLAIGGAIALVKPLMKGAAIAGGWGIA